MTFRVGKKKKRIKWRGDDLAVEAAIERELVAVRQATPDNPVLHGFKVYSQCDEDGILQHLLGRLPESGRTQTCLEIGCGFGLENNTHHLLLGGFRGVWVDADEHNIAALRSGLAPDLDHPQSPLRVLHRFVDRDNIAELVRESCAWLETNAVDFFSLDIDGNDLWVAEEALRHFRPAIVCLEYNAKFRPPLALSIRYESGSVWDERGDYVGASLSAYVARLQGYRLVCCGISGVNAFFVRGDLVAHFPSASYPVEALYRPMRHPFCGRPSGHEPTLRWLRDVIQDRVAAAKTG
jgi:hypothetical protein